MLRPVEVRFEVEQAVMGYVCDEEEDPSSKKLQVAQEVR
jgi:hypothetical protein